MIAGCLQRGVGGPVDAVEVGELERVRADRDRERGFLVVELAQHGVDLAVAGARARLRRPGARRHGDRCARTDFGSTSSAQPQEHRGAQHAVRGPLLELDLGDQLGLQPGRRAVQLGLLGEGAGSLVFELFARAFTCASVRSSNPEPTCPQ